MDELLKQARAELEPPWDDLREARVLSRVLEETGQHPRSTWRRPLVAFGVVTALGAAAALGLWLRSPAPDVAVAKTTTPSSAQQQPAVAFGRLTSLLSLSDGSVAHLEPGAEVRSLEQSPRVVRLLQPRGVVRYEVKPDATRPFTIEARGVEVRVIGTVFTVAVEPDGVRVTVERGRVAVKSGARAVELAPGESLRLSPNELDQGLQAAATLPSSRPEASAPAPVTGVVESPAALRDAADEARARGDLPAAERLLSRLLAEHSTSPLATSAAFSLGRIQSARGNFAAAARSFETLRRRAPGGPLAEDALAEAANAWALAGQSAQARSLSAEYLGRYPGGPHAERMRRLAKP